MGIFGWSLPPGVTNSMIDPGTPPCEVCGLDVDDCVCPKCPICGEQGNPDCYKEGPQGHDMEKTPLQCLEYQRFVVKDLEAQWKEAQQMLEYLEKQLNKQGD